MDAAKELSAGSAASARSSKLRYPLRSGGKVKDDKSGIAEIPASSSARRGRAASNVSKSVSVLELSATEKSRKPPRRLSIPPKSVNSPAPRFASNITPISETRARKRTSGLDKSDTPKSDASMSANRRKFSVISSVSYWLSQIKLSEAAAKHSISLGFFKLALDSGCEPLQRLRDELKSYVRRHNLLELGESTKELLKSYDISEDLGQVQVSETFSQGPDSSDEDSHMCPTVESGNLKPKCLNSENIPALTDTEKVKKENLHKRLPVTRSKESVNRTSLNRSYGKDGNQNVQRKCQRPTGGQDSSKTRGSKNNPEKKLTAVEDSADEVAKVEIQHEDKENQDVPEIGEAGVAVEV
ncbi:hypothetical protein H6P81_003731 [Aristolochia fimbriata]|uniref:Uncharacterized protein n=1 Tax=Aristolochia fimbriata TaxID=158543 RepID=A0AAV7FE92_ARIFI|nr:hypothetical protein H6P81_003731 [Aristolochia fimbriata]